MVKLLEEIELTGLSSLPHVLIKLLDACHEDSACFDTLTDIISKDAALSARILSVANSPVYGKAGKLTTYKQVLLYLGLDTIKSIAITSSVQQFFSYYSKEKNRFLKNFWKRTLFTAIVAKSLAKLTSYGNPEEAYLAGLLHDLGQLIFESYSKNQYSELVHLSESGEALLKSEFEKYNISHDEIGAQLLELWGLPEAISEAVKYHHAASEDVLEANHLVKIINLANKLTANDQLKLDELIGYEHRLFDLSDAVLRDVLNKAEAEVYQVAASLEIDIGDTQDSDINDEEKHIQLAKSIRDVSLTQGALQFLPGTSVADDFSSIPKSAMILFGLNQSCLFLYDADKNVLLPTETSSIISKSILEGIEISDESASLIAKSLNSGEMISSFADAAESLPVVDRQMIRAFNTDGILCLPLIQAGSYLGIFVIGINNNQYKKILKKSALLKLYTAEIADFVFAVQSSQKAEQDFIANSQELMQSNAKKIIHEVNNPLAVIRNYLHILGSRFNGNDQIQNDLNVISEEINRVGSIILNCDKGFGEMGKPESIQEVNINEVVAAINNIMLSSLYVSHNVSSNIELGEDIGLIRVSKNSLKQILTNLIKNAVEAMVENKKITITTRKVNINGKAFAEIEIIDTGPGIPDEILKNLYKPVKSTKGKRHSGLGLSIVKNLIDEMGGTITCKSASSGSAFSIHFPFK